MKRNIIRDSILLVILYFCFGITACNEQAGNSSNSEETAFKTNITQKDVDNSKILSLRLVVNDTYCKKTACECIHYLASREYEDLLGILKKIIILSLN